MESLKKEYEKGKYHLGRKLSILLLIGALLGYLVYGTIQRSDSENLHLSDAIHDHVNGIFQERGTIYVSFTNTGAKAIAESYNHQYEEDNLTLSSVLRKGDLVIKANCSDTLIVRRDNEEYIFLIGDHFFNDQQAPREKIDYWRKRRQIVTSHNDC